MVKETKVIDGKTWWLVSGVGFTGGIKRTAVEGWVCAESKDGKSQLGKTKDLPGTKIPSGGYLHFPVTRANNTKNQLTQLWGQNDVVDYTKYQEPDADGNLVTKYTGMAGHNGIDIDADLDDPILPVDSGVIVKAEYNKWLGNHIVVKHSWGTTTYAHLNTIDKSILDRIKAGDKDIRVDPNMTMGGAGTTGNSTGVHLHLQMTIDGQKTGYSWRETIDPLAYLDTKDYDTRPELKPPPPPSGTDVNPAKPK